MSSIETMQVIYRASPKGGPVVINTCDFDPEKHAELGETPAPKKRGRPKKTAPEARNGNC